MLKRSTLPRHASTLALTALALSTAACAGPRVGDVVGAPSTTTMTVQAKVVSATPVIGQVAVPRQVCYDELRQNPPRSSGAGAVMGAIAGGVIGNSVGKGAGKVLATGLGIFGGAIAGDRIENDGRQGTTGTVRRCDQQAEYENRVMAYNVVYEFAGQRFNTQMGQEPGATIPVQVTLTPAVAAAPVMAPAVYAPTPEPVYEEPYEPGWRRHRRWD